MVVSRKSHRQSSICLTTVKFTYIYCSKRVLRRNLRDGHDVDLGGITCKDKTGRKSMEVLR